MNFAREVLQAQPPERRALVELGRDGTRREWTFGEMQRLIEVAAGALATRGVDRGDVVMTLIGNRVEWVATMMACFHTGAVVLPCTEQLRAKDLRLRLDVTQPKLIVADERNRTELQAATPPCQVLWVPDDASLFASQGPPLAPNANLKDDDPALITFTSGTAGEPKAVVHGQRYLHGQRTQARTWLGAKPGDLVWCTASSGWSKSARNVFMAPWLTGAAALLHDARFDPHERLRLIEQEQVNVLCMAPTEYRVIAKRAKLRPLPSLAQMVAAGEALNPEVLYAWREATGLDVRDGYGQTETGQMTAMPIGAPARPGSMGLALEGVELTVEDGELVADPRTVPTFFLGYLGEGVRHENGEWRIEDRRDHGPWRTGDRVGEDADGYLRFEGRADDVIVSAGYRIGPFEVESALVAHPAVAEAAAVAAPDEERGSVVRAVVVLRDGHAPSPELTREMQEHVKAETAPYKYPRIIEFARELPKTASGKIRRALLRERVTGREWTADAEKVRSYLKRADRFPHRVEGEIVLLEHVPHDARRVLDLGTGDGRLLAMLQAERPNAHAVGLDFSELMLSTARGRFRDDERVELIGHDLAEPLPELGSFDAIVSSFAIHHLEHARKRSLYREVFDLLEPGGVFANFEHVSSPTPRLHTAFFAAIDVPLEQEDPSDRTLDVQTQLDWLRELGFDDVDCYWKWLEMALLIGVKPSTQSRG